MSEKIAHVRCFDGYCVLCNKGEAAFQQLPLMDHVAAEKNHRLEVMLTQMAGMPEPGYYDIQVLEMRRTPEGAVFALFTFKYPDDRLSKIPETQVFHGRVFCLDPRRR